MVKRRYGIINDKGVFNVKTDTYMRLSYANYFHTKSRQAQYDAWGKFNTAYEKAFDYTCGLDYNVAIALKGIKAICVWEMSNKENTYKEFEI